MKYTNWTKELLEPFVKKANGVADCLRLMGLVQAGGNFHNLKKNIAKFDLDTSHWARQAWNKDNFKPLGNLTTPMAIKKNLIRSRGHKCQSCNLTEWLNKPISLELEHIDGNRANNQEDNLKLLCPNCHAQTPTYRRKKASFESQLE